jgi:hypothetical protein
VQRQRITHHPPLLITYICIHHLRHKGLSTQLTNNLPAASYPDQTSTLRAAVRGRKAEAAAAIHPLGLGLGATPVLYLEQSLSLAGRNRVRAYHSPPHHPPSDKQTLHHHHPPTHLPPPPPPSTSHCIIAQASLTSHIPTPLHLLPPASGFVSAQPSPSASPTTRQRAPPGTPPFVYSTHPVLDTQSILTIPSRDLADPYRHQSILRVFLQTSDSVSGGVDSPCAG